MAIFDSYVSHYQRVTISSCADGSPVFLSKFGSTNLHEPWATHRYEAALCAFIIRGRVVDRIVVECQPPGRFPLCDLHAYDI